MNKLFSSKILWLQKGSVGVLLRAVELLCMLRDLAARKRAGLDDDNLLNFSVCLSPLSWLGRTRNTHKHKEVFQIKGVHPAPASSAVVDSAFWQAQELLNVCYRSQTLEWLTGWVQMHCATCVCASDTGGHSLSAALCGTDQIGLDSQVWVSALLDSF